MNLKHLQIRWWDNNMIENEKKIEVEVEKKKKFNFTILTSKYFKLEEGKSRIWSPLYKCEMPKTRGCITKKITTGVLFTITLISIIMFLLSVISIIYENNTGRELLPFVITAWFFMLPLFFFLVFIILPLTIINMRATENKIFKVIIIYIIIVSIILILLFVF